MDLRRDPVDPTDEAGVTEKASADVAGGSSFWSANGTSWPMENVSRGPKRDGNERDISRFEKIGERDTLDDPLRICPFERNRAGLISDPIGTGSVWCRGKTARPDAPTAPWGDQPQAVSERPQRKV